MKCLFLLDLLSQILSSNCRLDWVRTYANCCKCHCQYNAEMHWTTHSSPAWLNGRSWRKTELCCPLVWWTVVHLCDFDLITPIQCFPVTWSLIWKTAGINIPRMTLGERLGLMVRSEVIFIEVFGCFSSKSNTKAVKKKLNLQVYSVDASDNYVIRASVENRSTHKPSCSQSE